MPPRRARNSASNLSEEQILLVERTQLLVAPHLNDMFFQMGTQLNEKYECPICLELICCKHSFCLLTCGHYLHSSCYSRMIEPKCPICRARNTLSHEDVNESH